MNAQAKTEEFSKVEAGGFFKFEKVGDTITGTLTESKFQPTNVEGFKDQMVYSLANVTINGEYDGGDRRVGIAAGKSYVVDRMKKLSIGQRVKLAFESEHQTDKNKKLGMKPAKNIEVYAGAMDESFKPKAEEFQPITAEDMPF